jgi:hypothetical protein
MGQGAIVQSRAVIVRFFQRRFRIAGHSVSARRRRRDIRLRQCHSGTCFPKSAASRSPLPRFAGYQEIKIKADAELFSPVSPAFRPISS